MGSQSQVRPPRFLANVSPGPRISSAQFTEARPRPSAAPPAASRDAGAGVSDVADVSPPQTPIPVAPVPPPSPVASPNVMATTTPAPLDTAHHAARLTDAIEKLRMQGERLAEQARSDALEIGFQVARRILSMELTSSPQPLFALIRSAIQRGGSSRKVTVRLCPDDLLRVEVNGGKAATGLSVAQVELVADPALEPGDCVVDADFGSVDGRLTTRLDELRRAVTSATEADQS